MMPGGEVWMLWWVLLACKVECEAGTHEEDGECVADPVEETDSPPPDPCTVSSWCLTGTMTFTTIADTVNGEENTKAFRDIEDVTLTVHVGFEVEANYTIDDDKRKRRIGTTSMLTWFDPDPGGLFAEKVTPSLQPGELIFHLVGDQPDGGVILEGPTLIGDYEQPEVFEIRITGGKLDQTSVDYPELLPFSITGTRVEIARLIGVEQPTDIATGTADLSLAPAL